MELPNGVFVNEAAGAMAMLSDLWTALAAAHRERLGNDAENPCSSPMCLSSHLDLRSVWCGGLGHRW